MMKKLGFVFAVVLAGGASIASAQITPYGGNLSSSAGLRALPPSAFSAFGSDMPGTTGLGSTTPLLFSPNGGSVPSSPGLGYAAPSPMNPGEVGPMANPLSPTTRYPLVTCHPGGCSGVDGTQYARGAGNVMFGSNGKVCQYTAVGAPLVCN
jgi:hypothetical protein